MDTTTVNTLITAASGALVGIVAMYIHANQLGKRLDDLRTDMNRQFDRINQDIVEWNKIQREQDGRITDLERKKP